MTSAGDAPRATTAAALRALMSEDRPERSDGSSWRIPASRHPAGTCVGEELLGKMPPRIPVPAPNSPTGSVAIRTSQCRSGPHDQVDDRQHPVRLPSVEG